MGSTNFCTWLCILSSPAGGVWHSGRGRLAVSHPGELRYTLHFPTVSVCCQSPNRRGNHHHGDRLPGLRRRRQGEPAPAAQRKYRTSCIEMKSVYFYAFFFNLEELGNVLCKWDVKITKWWPIRVLDVMWHLKCATPTITGSCGKIKEEIYSNINT